MLFKWEMERSASFELDVTADHTTTQTQRHRMQRVAYNLLPESFDPKYLLCLFKQRRVFLLGYGEHTH